MPGALGKYTFTLVSAAPAPPDLDLNVWTLSIKDASGNPPPIAQLEVVPTMPQMGHGSDQIPILATNADGTFAISNLDLQMAGLWAVTVSVVSLEADGGKSTLTVDKAVFEYCVGN
jgi:hypothetical protein